MAQSNCFETAMDLELGEYMLDVVSNGSDADTHHRRNLFGASPFSKIRQDFLLPVCEGAMLALRRGLAPGETGGETLISPGFGAAQMYDNFPVGAVAQ